MIVGALRRVVLAGLSALAGLAAMVPATASAGWVQPVAAPLNASPSHDAQVPRMAVIGGVPYVAWHESNGTSNDVRVAKLAGGSWAAVGSPLDTSTTQYDRYPSIAGIGGVPYMAWIQLVSSRDQVEVSRFTAGSWSALGGSLNVDPTQHAEEAAIVGYANVPYVAWNEYNNTAHAEQIHVARFNGASWTLVGGVLNFNPSESALNPSIAVINGTLYVAWQEYDGTNFQVRVDRYNGGWAQVARVVNVNSSHDAEIPSIVGVNGVPWIAWDENNGTAHLVHVASLNGSWVLRGKPLNINRALGGFEADIASVGGVPYVAWRDQATGVPQVHVDSWAGPKGWVHVGGPLNVNPRADARTPSMVALGGEPWVAWQEMSGGVFQIRVKRFVAPTH